MVINAQKLHLGHLEILIFETDFGTVVCEIYLILGCNMRRYMETKGGVGLGST